VKEEPERADAELGGEDDVEGQVPTHERGVVSPRLGGEPKPY
jgi:hypothetical protein